MPDAPELLSIIESAERAAAAGDFLSAEVFLRQAVLAQESILGSDHPELANLFNNLGIVCENVGKLADAESCYRRAYAIASAALPADDPLVLTSGENLRAFCAAQGKPIDVPAPPTPPPAPKLAAQPVPVSTVPVVTPPPVRPSTPPTPLPSPRPAPTSSAVALPAPKRNWPVIAVAMLVTAGAVASFLLSTSPGPPPEETSPAVAPAVTPKLEVAEAPAPSPPVPEPAPPVAPPVRDAPALSAPAPSTAPAVVKVLDARVCRTLSTADWQCTPAASPVAPGALFFYTRLASPTEATVLHQWYYNDALLRTVRLRISANQSAGYRTYSRNTIAAERSGDWRVDLRTEDGTLLQQARFVVGTN